MINFIQFTFTRAFLAFITLLLVCFIVFSLMELVPGTCAERYLAFKNTQGSSITVEDITRGAGSVNPGWEQGQGTTAGHWPRSA
jgi:ABC-type dipeptide/oligopeptide/nickel transport system permease component